MMMVKCFANEQDDCGDQQVDVKGRPSKTPREPNLHQARHTPPHHYTPQPPPYYTLQQSHKNPVSASAMLTGKFLQIRKVFATSSLLAEEFPDTLQYKISR